MTGYRQASKSLLDVTQPRRVKTIRGDTYTWKFKYANTITTILCTSNGLICGYITGIHDKKTLMWCVTWNLPQSIGILRSLSSTLSTNYFAIIYAANNSQLTLYVSYITKLHNLCKYIDVIGGKVTLLRWHAFKNSV